MNNFLIWIAVVYLIMQLTRYLWDKYLTLYLLLLVMDSNINLGKFAPWIFGLAMGRWPHRVKDKK